MSSSHRAFTPLALGLLIVPMLLAGCASPTGGGGALGCGASTPPGGAIRASETLTPAGAPDYSESHPHVDFKVFLAGEGYVFARAKYYVSATKDRAVHLEGSSVYPEHEWGDVIHLHDGNVTLAYFLNTLGWKVNSGGGSVAPFLLTDEGDYFGVFANCRIRVYVEPRGGDWSLAKEGLEHVLAGGERILVTYGDEPTEVVDFQLASVTAKGRSSKL